MEFYNPVHMNQILVAAKSRWLCPNEVCAILYNYHEFEISTKPPKMPPSGSLFLFNRKILRYFRNDGHNWRKKKDGKTVNEAHERLQARIHCYYAQGQDNRNFRRRVYWSLKDEFMHIVLVHYLEVNGSISVPKFSRPGNIEASSSRSPGVNSSDQTSEYEGFHFDSYHMGSKHANGRFVSVQADSGGFAYPRNQNMYGYSAGSSSRSSGVNSDDAPPEYEDFDSYQASSVPCSHMGSEHATGRFDFNLASWEQILEHCNSEEENVGVGRPFTDELYIEKEVIGRSGEQREWQIASDDDSSYILNWPVEQQVQNDLQTQFLNAEVGYYPKSDLECSFTEEMKQQRLESIRTDEGLKKMDSFNRWLSRELGEVDYPDSGSYWDISPKLYFDDYSLIAMLLHARLAKLLSCDPGEQHEHLLREALKEKLDTWLVTEDGEGGLNVLDKDGQGVIHLASALGYDWAIEPIVTAGVNINFRDVNGWTALSWAAFYGRERTVGCLVSKGAAPGALTDPTPRSPSGMAPADLAYINGHRGIAGFLAEASLAVHLESLTMNEAKDGLVVPEQRATGTFDIAVRDASLNDSLAAVRNATQAHARIHQVFRVDSFQRKQLVENIGPVFGMSDEQALSLVAVKKHGVGVHDEPHVAAVRIQNKYRGYKGRKEFMIIRQQIVKIPAHVRGCQVRKQYKPIIWSVGIVEKIILRWRRKGNGLRGFQSKALTAIPTEAQSGHPNEDDYEFLKEGRKQTEERLQKTLARVKSMAHYPEAREQYSRLLTVVTDLQETKLLSDDPFNSSDGATDHFDDMIDLDTLLNDDTIVDFHASLNNNTF